MVAAPPGAFLTNTVKSENKDQKVPAPAPNPTDKWFEAIASMFELAAQSEGPEKTARLAGSLLENLRSKGIDLSRRKGCLAKECGDGLGAEAGLE